jgi:signal transduction histidine kinase
MGSGLLASFRSYAGVPLLSRAGVVIGVLRLLTYQPRNFAPEEVELLQQLANGAALALENARLLEQIRHQALELERTGKVKDEFLGIVSHELRTPLSAVMGYAALMQDGGLGKVEPEFADALGMIENQTKVLLTMINSILEVTSIEAGAAVVQNQETDLKALLDDIRSTYDFSLNKDVAFIWDYNGDLPRVMTDPGKLKHILQNLMNNAIKFTHEGHIALSARYLPQRRRVEFQVADTGVGIPPDMQPAIFERFRQVDSSHTRLYGGVGLGLYITKSFTQMLGGTVAVTSEPGRGSIFIITLPCEQSMPGVGDHSTAPTHEHP